MFITSFLFGVAVGVLLCTFIDEIIEFAKKLLNRLPDYIRTAKMYLQRVPGAIRAFIRYIRDGEMKEAPVDGERSVTPAELDEMRRNNEISQKTYEDLLTQYKKTHYGDIERRA
jgi:hypothetical protein